MENLKAEKLIRNLPSLPPADLCILEPSSIDAMWFPKVQKRVEQCGDSYELLKNKHARMTQRIK